MESQSNPIALKSLTLWWNVHPQTTLTNNILLLPSSPNTVWMHHYWFYFLPYQIIISHLCYHASVLGSHTHTHPYPYPDGRFGQFSFHQLCLKPLSFQLSLCHIHFAKFFHYRLMLIRVVPIPTIPLTIIRQSEFRLNILIGTDVPSRILSSNFTRTLLFT